MFEAKVDQLIYEFNCRPLGYVDESWVAPAYRPLLLRLRDSRDVQARASANTWLAGEFQLGHAVDFDFASPAKRLLLLEPRVLDDLALWVGLSGLSDQLRKWVDKPRRQALAQALGEAGHAFFLQHVLRWPPALRLAMPVPEPARWVPGQALDLPRRLGAAVLLSGCGEPGDAAVLRGRLKLARPFGDIRRRMRLGEARMQRVLAFCIGCVIREREPAWHWLF